MLITIQEGINEVRKFCIQDKIFELQQNNLSFNKRTGVLCLFLKRLNFDKLYDSKLTRRTMKERIKEKILFYKRKIKENFLLIGVLVIAREYLEYP